MREIRNSDGRLVCRVDEATNTIEISVKGCTTLISLTSDGKIKTKNIKRVA